MHTPRVPTARLRPPHAHEHDALTAIALAAKAHWGYPAEWLERWRAALTIASADLERWWVRVAADPADDTPLGFVAAAAAAPRWCVEHLWVHPGAMGRGIGHALLGATFEAARAAGAHGLELEADPNAVAFYEACGAIHDGAVPAPMPGAPERVLPRLVIDEWRDGGRRMVGDALHIVEGGLDDPRVIALLHTHVTRARAETARGSAHALDLTGLRAPDVTFWSAWEGEGEGDARTLVGVGALRTLSADHGEVKSMHTVESMRGRGIGGALVRHIVATARARRMARVSLETGASEYFAAARALYSRHGFAECPPFADYRPDPNSVFMTLELRAAPGVS